ncbi:putative O-glycosylation ligase, exosortase A system-associated [Erythrobacter sp. JK5]|uniref:putative O-glycosylation ligase, exosortase A system-associated n=1 Tax=Erythrobacter sp. JK5 TaxID=2829500 RepID=UPI001BA652A1|nr:putative O-glycosylation ligase, exosortase A system-associated [Erythrobacter sp. JK5]QUL37112.1 putative O-glycosylation ligase, exosortase A system-associated [Erythrobacter sp. JK5]
MLDLIFLAFIGYVLLLGLRRPFLWVLLYVYIDIIAPQNIGYALIKNIPVSLIAFGAAFGGWLMLDRKEGLRFSLRQALILALLLYCWWTTGHADFPEPAATKWDWVWKALLFAIFLPFTITTRARLEALALMMVLAVATIVIGTGMKTVLGGGGYENLKFFVNDNSGIYESSTLATVAIALTPMIAWFTRFGTVFRPHWAVTVFAVLLIFACLMVPIGTEARTGLVCIAVLGVLLLRYVKRRVLFAAAGAALGLVALPFLPQSYYERMATIAQPGGDESASTRVAVWSWTLEYVADKPFGGGFDAYRGNRFTYEMPVRQEVGNTTSVEFREVTDEARAYHSAIFELLGEQGWPGLAIWLLLHGLGVWQMERVRARWKDRREEAEAWIAPMATALQLASMVYITGALFQGIAYQPVMLMIVGLQIGLHNYCRRIDSARAALERISRLAPDENPTPKQSRNRRAPDAVTA